MYHCFKPQWHWDFATIVQYYTYNMEIWGLNDIQILENLCSKFYKFILRVPQNCSNLAVYADLGSPKLSVDASVRCLSISEE